MRKSKRCRLPTSVACSVASCSGCLPASRVNNASAGSGMIGRFDVGPRDEGCQGQAAALHPAPLFPLSTPFSIDGGCLCRRRQAAAANHRRRTPPAPQRQAHSVLSASPSNPSRFLTTADFVRRRRHQPSASCTQCFKARSGDAPAAASCLPAGRLGVAAAPLAADRALATSGFPAASSDPRVFCTRVRAREGKRGKRGSRRRRAATGGGAALARKPAS